MAAVTRRVVNRLTASTTPNPYLDEVLKYPCRCRFRMPGPHSGYGCTLCGPEIGTLEWRARLELRHQLIRRYAYAIPNEEALATLIALGPLVEIGAGAGYWASLLAARGGDIIAYDRQPGRNGWCDADPYFPVQRGPATAARRHPDRALFLCWPPYQTRLARLALHAYAGQRLAFIGEGDGGCTADDRFFARLDRDWRETQETEIPQWCGVHDTLRIFERGPI